MSAKTKVVLIDDEDMILDIYSRILNDAEYEVHTASNGKDGFDLVLKVSPDIVITDIIMDKKDGFYVIESVKGNLATKDIPVIAFTNLDNGEDRIEAERLGACAFLVKAKFTPSEFVKEIKKYLPKNN